jgi:hypothetical protein
MIHRNNHSSAIGWVDFSPEHREKVKSVLDLLSTPGVVDELGIGVVRDSFSDSLFPGISTIQTRAKYFLTVPRIFKDYEKLPSHQRRRRKLKAFLNECENLCMEAMVANHEDDRQEGIIGQSFAEKQGEVQRKPSSVYWAGIRRFGLIQTNLSLQAFCRRFANPDQPLHDLVQGSDKLKGDDPDAVEQSNETINGPSYDDDGDWIASLRIHLSHEEAVFLSHQIEARVPLTLLGQVLLDPDLRKQFLALPNEWNFTIFADNAPFIASLPADLRRIIEAARDFWQLIYGAHIRYNCLLQQRHGTAERRQEFEALWQEWLADLHAFPWRRWDTEFLWELAKLHRHRVREYTTQFVESWIDGVRNGAALATLNDLVIRQERFNKKARARLDPTANESIGKWIGIDDLNYRLNVARTIISDIHDGLNSTDSHHA